MAFVHANRVKVATATTGTGTVTLGAAADTFQSFADGGVANGDTVTYLIQDGSNWEIGTGTYNSTGPTMARSVIESTNADAAINLSGSATVSIVTVASVIDTFLTSSDIGGTVQGYDVDTLKADVADTLTAGYRDTLDDDGTQSSGTYTPTDAAGTWSKAIVNNGAFTLAPPSPASGTVIYGMIFITNGASAGTITTSGWTKVSGDSFTTTNGHDFVCNFIVVDKAGTEYSLLNVTAMQ